MLTDFDFRSNSIGFLRFLFASMVIWSHSFNLGGFGPEPLSHLTKGVEDVGSIAVDGFFVLSGFLITRSYERIHKLGRYLWHRALRIFPAFWACLIVVSFGFAPVIFFRAHGSMTGFFGSPNAPWSYVTANALLQMRQYNIAGLLTTVPYPLVFNHSLWTLQYEFYCYLAVGVLGPFAFLNRRPLLALAPFVLFLSLFAFVSLVRGLQNVPVALRVIELYAFFAAGACAYLFRNYVPTRGPIALACAAAIVVTISTRAYGITLPVCLSYLTLYAAMKLPLRSFDRRFDFSYGLYIYAYPIQQALSVFRVNAFGFSSYCFVAFLGSLVFAAASWFAIEERSLRLKKIVLSFHRQRVESGG